MHISGWCPERISLTAIGISCHCQIKSRCRIQNGGPKKLEVSLDSYIIISDHSILFAIIKKLAVQAFIKNHSQRGSDALGLAVCPRAQTKVLQRMKPDAAGGFRPCVALRDYLFYFIRNRAPLK